MDLDGSQVWPAFTDVHTHLDKGHILPRIFNPDGSHPGAAQAVMRDRSANWSAGDVRRRFEFGLACAFAHGTAAIRTHLDSQPPQATISFPVFSEMREAWAGRIELQAVGMLPLDDYLTPAGEEFAALVARHGGLLGGPSAIRGQPLEASRPLVRKALDALFRLADRHGLDIDLHVDESGDPAAQTLGLVARAAIEHRFQGRVTCGHCCSLAVQPADVVRETLDLCAEAGLAVVSLPMVNLYLQDRHAPATPRWRGVTLVHELKARGVPVAVASDNCRDPFYAFGDHDVFEVFNQSVRICHLDVPYGDWPRAVTATPAAIMKRTHGDALRVGAPADLIIFRGRSMNELLARPQADRIVLRAGHAIDTTLPDHRILDDLFAPPASR
jgi:cytosine deaminase